MTDFPKRLKLHFYEGHDGTPKLLGECREKNSLECSICSGKLLDGFHKILKEVVEYERLRV